ncbi:MAG: 4Fe-4S cluster-binding domain-containing protein [Prevotellaceae bacterium]|jgi:organic radical activating enzyme|nr:4Fe-4S cluster-binding domain-containing protein [Prevotellaceae bacterium]
MKINELYVELTRRCNLRCAHCFYGEAQDAVMNNDTLEMTFQVFKEMEWLVAGGGEPFLNFNGVKRMIWKVMKNKIRVNNFFIATNGCFEGVTTDELIAELKSLHNNRHVRLLVKLSNTPYHRTARTVKDEARYQSFKQELKQNGLPFFELMQDEEFINSGLAKENGIKATENQIISGDSETIARQARRDGVCRVTFDGYIIQGCGHSYADNDRHRLIHLRKFISYSSMFTDLHPDFNFDKQEIITALEQRKAEQAKARKERKIKKIEEEKKKAEEELIEMQKIQSDNRLFFDNLDLIRRNSDHILKNEKYSNIIPMTCSHMHLGEYLEIWKETPLKFIDSCDCGGILVTTFYTHGSICSGMGRINRGRCMKCGNSFCDLKAPYGLKRIEGSFQFTFPHLYRSPADIKRLEELINQLKSV